MKNMLTVIMFFLFASTGCEQDGPSLFATIDSTLHDLSIDQVELTPAFSRSHKNYSVNLPYSISSLSLFMESFSRYFHRHG